MKPAANLDSFVGRTARAAILIDQDAPAWLIADEAWLVIKAYTGGYWRALWWVIRKRIYDMRISVIVSGMSLRHRIGRCADGCIVCIDERLDALDRAQFSREADNTVRATMGSLYHGEPYPEVDIRGVADFARDVEPRLNDTLSARLDRYEAEQRAAFEKAGKETPGA